MSNQEVTPTFHTLDLAESEAVLGRHNVGRIAYTFHDRVDIEPIHYVFETGRIFGRMQFGKKMEVLSHAPWVAFEVDEVEGLFDWRSVVVHGRIVFPDPNGPPADQAQHARGVEVFQQLIPNAFIAGDPTPARAFVFLLHINDISGRAASSSKGT